MRMTPAPGCETSKQEHPLWLRHSVRGSAVVQSLLQGIQHEAGMCCPADPPAHDVAGINVDHECDIDEPAL